MSQSRKRRIPVKLAAVVAALWLGACGGGGDGEGDASPPPPPPPPPPPAGPTITGRLPESVNDTTLAGEDSDDDGVRDDVETYIASLDLEPEQEAIARNFAEALQTAILIDFDSEAAAAEALEASERTTISAICFTRDNAGDASVLSSIQAETLNNRDRMQAQARFDALLDGSVFTVPAPERLDTLCNEAEAGG